MICQGIATYESYHESDSSFDGSVTNVVFHLEDLPLCIALFLNPGPLGTRLERARLPDLAQIVVFGLTVYFYCHFMPTSPDSGVARIVGSHVLVGVFFYFRAVTIRSDIGSAMFGRWTLALLLSVVNDAYSLNSELDPLTGEMFDLVWSSELMLWTLIAATWRQTRPMPTRGARPAPDRALRVMPVVVACFTVVLAVSLAKYQPVVAAPLAAASLLCTALVLRSRAALSQNLARKNMGRTPSR
jgi:hypothetical protein